LGEYSSPGMDVCPTDTVVDIGAHTGVFSVIAARKASKGRVIAVEPDPKNFQVLQRNLQLNNLENVVPVQAAVWRDGRCRLTQIGDYNNNSTLHPDALVAEGAGAGGRRVRLSEWMDRHHLANQSVSVQSVSLLSLIRRYRLKRIDLLKIDCEGSEYDILWNAPASALNRMRRIAMECHTFRGRRTPGRMACFLRKAGFDVRVQSDGPNDLNPIIFALRPNARAGRWRAKRPPAKYF
jgi:FkbM family methyltransferase